MCLLLLLLLLLLQVWRSFVHQASCGGCKCQAVGAV
jgi:hypothetical protein